MPLVSPPAPVVARDPVPFHEVPGLDLLADGLLIVDVGAQRLEGEEDVHRPLLRSGRCRVIGFEPQEGEHEDRHRQDGDWTMLPYALGDGTRATLYETVWSPTSSLYEPDMDLMNDFAALPEFCEVVSTRELDTHRLDDVLGQGPVDFLKLDVQGAELDVLRGAERTLAETLVVFSEVEFTPIYRGQPLFHDVTQHLRERGFDLFDITRLIRYHYSAHPTPTGPLERLVWGDAVFIPTRDRLDVLDERRTVHLAWIMHALYGSQGFVRWLLARFVARAGTHHATSYEAAYLA